LWFSGWNSGPSPWATPPAQFFVIGFFKIGSRKLFARLGLNCDPPDLYLGLQAWATYTQQEGILKTQPKHMTWLLPPETVLCFLKSIWNRLHVWLMSEWTLFCPMFLRSIHAKCISKLPVLIWRPGRHEAVSHWCQWVSRSGLLWIRVLGALVGCTSFSWINI
jgi:hypothetical protein